MDSSDETREANRTRSNKQVLSAEHRELVDQLAERWRSHTGWDGEIRYNTGRMLNATLGPPTERSPEAQRVMTALAEKMGVAASDLGRMRRSGHRFDNILAKLRATYPAVTNPPRPEEVFPRLLVVEGE